MLKNNHSAIHQFMVLVYFTAGLAICGMMANRSIPSDLPITSNSILLLNMNQYVDKDTVIYNHFIQ